MSNPVFQIWINRMWKLYNQSNKFRNEIIISEKEMQYSPNKQIYLSSIIITKKKIININI